MAQGRIWLLGGSSLAAAVGVAGWIVWQSNLASDPVAPPEPRAEAAPAVEPEPEGEPEPEDVAAPVIVPPGFDVVRVSPEGGALVAGRAQAGAAVSLRLDEAPVAETPADDRGQFVALFELGPSEAPQVLTLSMTLEDGTVVPSLDVVILAPRPAPPGVAEAAPDPLAEAPAESRPPDPEPVETAVVSAEPEPEAEPRAEPVSDPEPVSDSVPEAAPPQADPPPAFVLEGSGQVRVLDPAPLIRGNVVIDAISYAPDGTVQISGRTSRAGSGIALRLYLDNQPAGSARSADGLWMAELAEVVPGVHTLRVDELDETGQVVSRFETPFLREDPAVVARHFGADLPDSGVTETGQATGTSAPPEESVAALEPLPEPVADADFEESAVPVEVPSTVAFEEPSVVTEPEAEPHFAEGAEPAEAPVPESVAPSTAPAEEALAQDAAVDAVPEVAEAPPPPAPLPPPAVAPEPPPAMPALASVPEAAEAAASPLPAPAAPLPGVTMITVQPGQSLWRISRDHYGEGTRYVRIYRANRGQIRNPDRIYPGQIFTLPE